jgi:hypothetical protein
MRLSPARQRGVGPDFICSAVTDLASSMNGAPDGTHDDRGDRLRPDRTAKRLSRIVSRYRV